MNWKADAVKRGQERPRQKLPCYAGVATMIVKCHRPNRAVLPLAPWRFATENPTKCSRSRVQPLPHICSLNQLFQPIFPDSSEPVCGRRECSDPRFNDVMAARSETDTGSGFRRNPIYVLFTSCLSIKVFLKFKTQPNQIL